MPVPLRAFGSRHSPPPFEGRLDGRKRKRFQEQAKTLPKAPGVYFFYGMNDRLLYIGKAKCLRERVRSYFANTQQPRPAKIKRLLLEITRMDFQEVGGELEALLLERRLIAERQPILNRQHKRFNVYPYLLLSDEAFPRLTITRAEPIEGEADSETRTHSARSCRGDEAGRVARSKRRARARFRGAISARSPRRAMRIGHLEAVVKLFPLRLCDDPIEVDPDGRGCFYRELGAMLRPVHRPNRARRLSAHLRRLSWRFCKPGTPRKSRRCARAWNAYGRRVALRGRAQNQAGTGSHRIGRRAPTPLGANARAEQRRHRATGISGGIWPDDRAVFGARRRGSASFGHRKHRRRLGARPNGDQSDLRARWRMPRTIHGQNAAWTR